MMNAPSPSHSPTSSLTGKMSEKSAIKSDEGPNYKDNGVSGGVLSVLRGQQQHDSPTSLVLLPPESNLPMFPSLRGPHQANSNAIAANKRPIDVVANHAAAAPPPPPLSSMNIQDIAKEALRLTRETLLSQEQQQQHLSSAAAATTNTEAPVAPTSKQNEDNTIALSLDDEVPMVMPPKSSTSTNPSIRSIGNKIGGLRLNKFVRRLHDMLVSEKDSGIVEWRRGLLVLLNTEAFAKQILPKYFNTRNFKTFRRQLNYYGFVHVRSFSNTSNSATTALWVNKDLAETSASHGTKPEDIASVLLLKRVEACETAKTVEGRRVRKNLAISVVEEDLGVSAAANHQSLPIQASILCNTNNTSITAAKEEQDHHHQQQHQLNKMTVPLEHHNHNTATSSLIMPSFSVPLEISCPNYRSYVAPPHTVSTSSGEVSSSSSSKETTSSAAVAAKPPTSSMSAANLLLLLSKTN